MLYERENPHGGDVYRQPVRLDFSVNTNPLGPPPSVVRAVEASARLLDRYPDPCCRELVRALAAYEGVPERFILCGCGAAELIYAYCGALRPRGALELALTDGTAKNLPVEEAMGGEVLAFVREAIAPYVAARTVGFDTAFGVDERLEFNGERGVFHILRQSGREITGEWPVDALRRCAWTENRELTALGSVVSSGISLFKSATKAAGSQPACPSSSAFSMAGMSSDHMLAAIITPAANPSITRWRV